MSRRRTSGLVKNLFGDSLYQKRAREVFPILVRQAIAQQKITYAQLAEEVGIPNPRNLNYVLGSIGTTLIELGKKWREKIPAIQCLVVNGATGLPGDGADEFIKRRSTIQKLSLRQKDALVMKVLAEVFAYPKWGAVMQALELEPATRGAGPEIEAARVIGAKGESKAHRELKEFVSLNPHSVGLTPEFGPGKTEFSLPSGDSIDVVFQRKAAWIAVEVKSRISTEQDITRGLFQCVKYRAILDAWRGYLGDLAEVRVILVLEKQLPLKLVALRNTLGVKVIENVSAGRNS
ncbi:MAG: hypothetical protein U0Z53_27870 [Blastocatellia bacterium]